jgi:hypothetical protein
MGGLADIWRQYDLADQGGELCSLRYDLTVPFGRTSLVVEAGLYAETVSSPILGHEQGHHLDQALPHRQGLPPRPAGSEQGPYERVCKLPLFSFSGGPLANIYSCAVPMRVSRGTTICRTGIHGLMGRRSTDKSPIASTSLVYTTL